MAKSNVITSSLGRKIVMAASGLFLMFFLLQHLFINFTSVLSPRTFNELSHFMGTNVLVQFLMQPLLIAGVLVHFIMGIAIEMKNNKARVKKYVKNNAGASSSWMSRNMIYSGAVILGFLGLHFYDFWIPEIKIKFVEGIWDEPTRYYAELVHKFVDPVRVIVYCLCFVMLSLHLLHGFGAAFQSVGVNSRYSPGLKKFGAAFAIIVPAGFVFIAVYHHLAH